MANFTMHTRLTLALVFLCVAAMLTAAPVPNPASHFGHPIGVDRELLDWDKVVSYFKSLPKASDRILVEEIGKTTLGRPYIYAIISAPENLKQLDRWKQQQAKLADPRKLAGTDPQQLIVNGKTVVLITCSIHSTEVASTHTAVEFAYKMLTEDTPKHRAILQNTIFLLVPSLNPDGVDIVTQWYRKTLNTPYEGSMPPELYHKYVGHDDNRDWYIFSQVETQLAISKIHNVWHPQIVYDVHQQGLYASRMFVPPWLDPVEPNLDPIIVQWCNAIGSAMAADLTAAGKTGVAINAMYDFWSPARNYQSYHGGLRILSESASARLATPITVKPQDITENALGYDPRVRSWNYLEPWMGGEWHLRDIIDYQLIAMESCLYHAAIQHEDMLRSFYTVSVRQNQRATPYAFVIPADQADPGAARKMLETLQFGMVDIEQAKAPFQVGEKQYAAGSYVVRMKQPYGGFAKALLEKQDYPDLRLYPGGPPKRPYDTTAETLPLLMGVQVDTVKDTFAASLSPSQTVSFAKAQGPALSASDTDSWKSVNQIWKSGGSVYRDATTGNFAPTGSGTAVKAPRVGLYRSYIPQMDEGWTRWLLDQFGFTYTSVKNPEILAGNLRQKYDVIVFPDQNPQSIQNGYREGMMPPEYTGGLGEKGAAALKEFAQAGGTLVFLNESSEWAIERLGLPVKNVLRGAASRDFYSPGSLLNVTLQQPNPLTYGLPASVAIWSEQSPAFEVSGDAKSIAQYVPSHVLASGWLLGEKLLVNKSALVDAPVGQGHVLLFGLRPQYRAQSYQGFKLLFNALLYHN